MSDEPVVIPLGSDDAQVLIDPCDEARVREHQWYARRHGACAIIDGREVAMHRLLMEVPEGVPVGHLNGNLLDNRRENLYRSKMEVRGLFLHNAPKRGRPRWRYLFRCRCQDCPARKNFPYTVAGLAQATAFARAHYASGTS